MVRTRPRSAFTRAKRYLIPHAGNRYRPGVFRAASVAGLVALVLILEGAYFGATRLVFPNTGFLASVLPGALVALTNTDRQDNGVPAVTENPKLDAAANMAANDMATKGYFAHVSPDGTSPWYWLQEAGYAYSYAGENLAVDFTDSKDVETAWMNSPTHRANIVKAAYTEIGIGVADGTYEGKPATFVVQFFATPAAHNAPTPTTAPTAAPTAATTSKTGVIARAAPPTPAEGTLSPEIAIANTHANVLGVAATPAAPVADAEVAATSPTYTLVYILSALAILIGLLMLIALYVHVSVRYVEALGGGVVALVVVTGFLVLTASHLGQGIVPKDVEPAAVSAAL